MSTAVKVLIVLTSHSQLGSTGKATGWYLPEVSHPYYALTAEGFQVDFASPQGGKAPMDESSRDLNDPENAKFLADKALVERVQNTIAADKVDPSKYRAILYAGGHGTMWDFADNQALAKTAAKIYENGGVVAAVCHGPAALVNIQVKGEYLVKGKKVATFTDSEEKAAGLTKVVPFLLETTLRKRGANIQLAPDWSENVAVDQRLVTGQNPASAAKVGREMAKLLKSL